MSSAATAIPRHHSPPGPLHAILLGGTLSLFLAALLSDIAYFNSYQIQWSNFASWLLAGGLVLCGLTLLFALIRLLRAPRKAGPPLLYFLVLLATWVLGLLDAFEHAKDAWAAMPSGLILSSLVVLLACAAALIGMRRHAGGQP